jgi:hypothetical protein
MGSIDELPQQPATREVLAKRYGEGWMPVHPRSCPYRGEIACVSRSGDSLCGGFGGGDDAEESDETTTVMCTYAPDPDENGRLVYLYAYH